MTRPAVSNRKFPLDPIWRLIFADKGLDAAAILKLAQLPADLLTRTAPTLSDAQTFRLWNALIDVAADPLLPLNLGQSVPIEAFTPQLFAAWCSPNMMIATQRLSEFKRLSCPISFICEHDDTTMTITVGALAGFAHPPRSHLLTELVFLVYLIRRATRQTIVPMAVRVPERLDHSAFYSDYFGVDAITVTKQTAAPTMQLVFAIDDAKRAFLTENPEMWAAFEPHLRQRLAEVDQGASFATRVQAVLHELLPSGQVSANEVAKRMALSRRTLQRKLTNENTSFQQQVVELRKELASHYLTKGSYNNSEIALLLGFDDPNSFSRAYQDWMGYSISEYRHKLAH